MYARIMIFMIVLSVLAGPSRAAQYLILGTDQSLRRITDEKNELIVLSSELGRHSVIDATMPSSVSLFLSDDRGRLFYVDLMSEPLNPQILTSERSPIEYVWSLFRVVGSDGVAASLTTIQRHSKTEAEFAALDNAPTEFMLFQLDGRKPMRDMSRLIFPRSQMKPSLFPDGETTFSTKRLEAKLDSRASIADLPVDRDTLWEVAGQSKTRHAVRSHQSLVTDTREQDRYELRRA